MRRNDRVNKQKITPKNKRKQTKKKGFLKNYIFPTFKLFFLSIKFVANKISVFKKNKPKVFTFLLISVFLSIIVSYGLNKIKKYSENILPNSIDLEINNSRLHKLINDDLSKAFTYSQRHHETRNHFLKRVDNILLSYDQIDQYWIRLGLDKKLQITTTLQVPQIMLETKQDSYIISSTAKIIAKNANPNDFLGLYKLSIPELKITWKPKLIQQKFRNNSIISNKYIISNNTALNFPWVINQTKFLYAKFQELSVNYYLTKVTWNSEYGFNLSLLKEQDLLKNENVAVILGKDNLDLKISRLKEILSNVSQRNIQPTVIDLDYLDKASFKANTDTQKLGDRS